MKKFVQRLFKKKPVEHFISAEGTQVKILFSSENPSLLGRTVKTKAIEMSPRSIRLEVHHAIEIDSVLDISIELEGSQRSYHLTGNVGYRLPSIRGQYHVVLILRERGDITSDLKAWKRNFTQNFEYSRAV